MEQTEKTMMHVGARRGEIGKYVFLPGSPERSEKIAGYLDGAKKVAYHREYLSYTGTLCGVPVTVCSAGIGGPSTAIGVEELVECGAEVFLRVGTCNSVSPLVRCGDLVIPNGAVRMEGVALQYAPVEYPAVPDMGLVRALESAAAEAGYAYHIGTNITRAHYYTGIGDGTRPNDAHVHALWQAYLSGGALSTDMESAVLFIVAGCLNVRAAAVLLAATDCGKFSDAIESDPAALEYRSIETAVAAMQKIILQDRKA